jgi:dipeptidase E
MCINLKKVSKESLKKYNAIYVGGGNTYKLLQDIYKSGFISILKEYIENGGIYYGGSAGAIIIGSNIAIVKEENDKNYKYEEGLDMVQGFSILCHYNGTQDEKIGKFMSQYNNNVIALPERTGLHCTSRGCRVVGFESAYLFNRNKKIEYPENSTISL